MSAIEWEDPPPQPTRRNEVGRFVEALKAQPGTWAVYDRADSGGSLSSQRKKRYPGTEWTTRSNGDGTFTSWGRWVGES